MGKKITLAVFCGIIGFGVILALVGVMLGGSTGNFGYEDNQIIYREGDQQISLAQAPSWVNRLVSRASTGRWSPPTPPTPPSPPEVPTAPAPFSSSELKKLDIDVGAGYIIVQPGDTLGLSVDGPMSYTDTFENGEWTVKADPPNNITTREVQGRTHFFHSGEDITTTFTFTVPFDFDELDVEIDMGEAYVGGLTLKELDCSTGMGAITLSELSVGKAELSASMGAIDATGFYADNLDMKCEMGGISIEGDVTTRLNAKCEMGSIYALLEEPADYGWSAKADFGSATVDGHSASGLDSISSGGSSSANTFFNLECGMGSIEIEFN